MDEKDQEQVRRQIEEAIRDLAGKGESNVQMAAKIAELDMAVKFSAGAFLDFRKDMYEGFKGINHRLDQQNGFRAEHEQRLDKLDNRVTVVESTWAILRLLVPMLGAVATALIVAQLLGRPPV